MFVSEKDLERGGGPILAIFARDDIDSYVLGFSVFQGDEHAPSEIVRRDGKRFGEKDLPKAFLTPVNDDKFQKLVRAFPDNENDFDKAWKDVADRNMLFKSTPQRYRQIWKKPVKYADLTPLIQKLLGKPLFDKGKEVWWCAK